MNILKKWIGADQVDDTKILLRNDQYLRARNAADDADINLLKVNASDIIELMSLPEYAGSPLATESYVASAVAAGGSAFVAHAAHGANINVANPGTAVFDGRTLTTGMYLFLFGQTNQQQNGPWIFDTSSTALARPTGWTNTTVLTEGRQVQIDFGGTAYGNTLWALRDGGTVGTNNLVFDQIAGTGANTSLSNLTTTSINQNLLPATDGVETLGSTLKAWNYLYTYGFSGPGANGTAVNMSTGQFDLLTNGGLLILRTNDTAAPQGIYLQTNIGGVDEDVNTGFIEIGSTAATGTGTSGPISLAIGNTEDGNAGQITLQGGNATGTGNGSDINLQAGQSESGTAGSVTIQGGASTGSANAGSVQILAGASTTGAAGTIQLSGGQGTTGQDGGQIFIQPGAGNASDGGDLLLYGGDASGPGETGSVVIKAGQVLGGGATEGKIKLQANTPTVGWVWTATNADGSGEWAVAGSGAFANVTLSNLTSPTAINQDLIFAKASAATLQTKDDPNTVYELIIAAGTAINVDGADLTMRSGSSNLGNSGIVEIHSGDQADNNFITSGNVILRSGNGATSAATGSTGNVSVYSGALEADAAAGNSGALALYTGNIGSSTGVSGAISMFTGDDSATGGGTGAISIATGTSSGAGASGQMNISTGTGNIAPSGAMFLQTGITGGDDTTDTGLIQIFTGDASAGANTGNLILRTGDLLNSTDNGKKSGDVQIFTGNVTDAAGGDVRLFTGTHSGTGAKGKVKIEASTVFQLASLSADPSNPQAGDQYYNTTSNSIRWYNGTAWASLASGSGANQTLSNLTSPTAINQNLIFNMAGSSILQTKDQTAQFSNDLMIKTGDTSVVGDVSGALALRSGDQTGEGNTGGVQLYSGNTADGSSGEMQIFTGDANGTGGNSGNVTISTGNSVSGTRGEINFNAATIGLIPDVRAKVADGKFFNLGSNSGAPASEIDGDMYFDTSSGVARYRSNGGGGVWVDLWPNKPIKETITLVSGDITNQYIDLDHIAQTDSIRFMVRGANGELFEGASYDYTVSYTGGAGGNTRITFLNDIATGGASELVAGDILQICYLWNFQ